MKWKRRLAVCGSVVALALSTRPAAGDEAGVRAADALFREGRELMKNRDYAAACDKFLRSQQLDPAAGTAINLGDCFQEQGKVASALLAYQTALSLLRASDARAVAVKQQISVVEGRVPRLTLRLRSGAPIGTTVTRDGRKVDAQKLGKPVAVNPGKHVVVVAAPDREDAQHEVVLAEGELKEIVLDAGEPNNGGATAPTPTRELGERPRRSRREPPKDSSPPAIGYALAGVAVVGLAGFVGFGLAGNSKKSQLDTCKPNCLDHSVYSDMKSNYLLANVSLAIGVVAGAAAFFTLQVSDPSQAGGTPAFPSQVKATRATLTGTF